MAGPLKGIRVVEMVGLGPCPFAAMMLADMGAEVIRVDRKAVPGAASSYPFNGNRFEVMARGRRSLALDLKQPEATEAMLKLLEGADALIEGFRPGVMERLGLGPDLCFKHNPKLVYGRVTGWGQAGPLAKAAGHDLNYIAMSGLLHAIGPADRPPPPPLSLVGDFGGGGMLFAFGVACALLEARGSGKGQVIDAAMLDGSTLLGALNYGARAQGFWIDRREANFIDGGAHFYNAYECADGKYISVAAVEPQFYRLLLELSGISDPDFDHQNDREKWPQLKAKIAAVFKTKSRQAWCDLMEGSDVCFAPVLDMAEAPNHPHNRQRGLFIELDGVTQPAPAPRFSRTVPEVSAPPATPGQHSQAILKDWNVPAELIGRLMEKQVI